MNSREAVVANLLLQRTHSAPLSATLDSAKAIP